MRTHARLIPRKFNAIFSEQHPQFIGESDPAMMGFLIANVLGHGGGVGMAHAEGAVSILPFEPAAATMHPSIHPLELALITDIALASDRAAGR